MNVDPRTDVYKETARFADPAWRPHGPTEGHWLRSVRSPQGEAELSVFPTYAGAPSPFFFHITDAAGRLIVEGGGRTAEEAKANADAAWAKMLPDLEHQALRTAGLEALREGGTRAARFMERLVAAVRNREYIGEKPRRYAELPLPLREILRRMAQHPRGLLGNWDGVEVRDLDSLVAMGLARREVGGPATFGHMSFLLTPAGFSVVQ